MKPFVAALAFVMVPAVASALEPVSQMQPWSSASGVVKTTEMYCGMVFCPPAVTVGRTKISGPLAVDLAAYAGNKVTVLGTKNAGTLEAAGFAAGDSKNFVTGTVTNTNTCAAGEKCDPHWAIKMGNYLISVDSNPTLDKALPSLEGSTVTLRGVTTPFTCPVGADCVRLDSGTFKWNSGTDISVKGSYTKDQYALNGETGVLSSATGSSIPTSGTVKTGGSGEVWATGKIGFDPIGGGAVLRVTSSKEVGYGGAGGFINPMLSTGANVGRAAGTTGANGAAATPASTANGGFHH